MSKKTPKSFTVYMEPKQLEKLERYRKLYRLSYSDIIRMSLEMFFAQYPNNRRAG